MYILTEGTNFPTLLKENYAITLGSCYFITKNVEHGIEHDIDSAYRWNLHSLDIPKLYIRFEKHLAI